MIKGNEVCDAGKNKGCSANCKSVDPDYDCVSTTASVCTLKESNLEEA